MSQLQDATDRVRDLFSKANLQPARLRSDPGFARMDIDVSQLLRGVKDRTTVVILPDRAFSAPELADILIRQVGIGRGGLPILVAPSNHALPRLEDFDFVRVTLTEINSAWERKILGEFLKKKILSEIPRQRLNPYQSKLSVSKWMFFGRRSMVQDLADMSSSKENYAVVGPRRAGKSSLASFVKESLRDDPDFSYSSIGNRNYFSVSKIDLDALVDPTFFWDAILSGMGLEQRDIGGAISKRLRLELRRTPREKYSFEILEDLIRHKYRKAVLILDEVDDFLDEDAKDRWHYLRMLRSLVDQTDIKVILIGYQSLFKYLRDPSFPLFGRIREMRLANLELDAVMDLIQVPMEELGFHFQKLSAIRDAIARATGSMPNLIQDICREMLLRQTQTNSDLITPSAVDDLLTAFGPQIIRTLHGAFRQLDEPLAKVIAYESVGMKEVTAPAMLQRLRGKHSLQVFGEEVESSLDYLYLHNVYHSAQRRFFFASELLEQALKEDLRSLPYVVDDELERFRLSRR